LHPAGPAGTLIVAAPGDRLRHPASLGERSAFIRDDPNHFWSWLLVQMKKRAPAGTLPLSPALSKGAERTGSDSPALRLRVVPAALQAAKLGPSSPTRTGRAAAVIVSAEASAAVSSARLVIAAGSPQAAKARHEARKAWRMRLLVARRARKIYAGGTGRRRWRTG
jgi:hypothetical protein